MALPIRQNATHKVVLGPVVAVGDGFTPITTLSVSTADEAEAILHDNGTVVSISGYTFAAITTADGYYHLTLQSGISGTVGHLTIAINDDSLCLPVSKDFVVVEEAVYDLFYASGASALVTLAAVTHTGAVIPTVTTVTTTTTNTDMRGTDNAALASVATEGRLAELDAANLPADIAAIPTTAMRGTDNAALASVATEGRLAELDAANIPADLDNVLTDTGTTIPALLPAALVGGRIDANIGAVSTSTTAATKMEASFEAIVTGVVGVGSTTTTIVLTSTDPAFTVDDQPNGKIITFGEATTTAALRGQSTDITDYDHGTVTITFTALTTAPVSGDVFIIT